MKGTLKEATVEGYHCDSRDQLRENFNLFIDAYSIAHQLKILHGLRPYEHIASRQKNNQKNLNKMTTAYF